MLTLNSLASIQALINVHIHFPYKFELEPTIPETECSWSAYLIHLWGMNFYEAYYIVVFPYF